MSTLVRAVCLLSTASILSLGSFVAPLCSVDAQTKAVPKDKQGVQSSTKLSGGNAQLGMKLFRQNNCSMCHPGGENSLNPLKPIKGAGFLKKYPNDKQLADHIRCGSPGTGMPAFPKSQISDAEMRDIIAYIRSLTPAASPTPAKKTSK